MSIRLKRYWIIDWVYSQSTVRLIVAALVGYGLIGLAFGFTYLLLQECFNIEIMEGNILHWYDYLYFSFITQTTVGYGDFSAISLGRLLCPLQAVLGLFALSLITPLVIVKLWAPRDSVIFADEAILTKNNDDRTARFLFRCINSHKMLLRDVSVICYFKIVQPKHPMYGYGNVPLGIHPNQLPYIAWSDWYFETTLESESLLYDLLATAEDYTIKILVTGMYGTSPYAIEHNYKSQKIFEGTTYVRLTYDSNKDKSISDDFHKVVR